MRRVPKYLATNLTSMPRSMFDVDWSIYFGSKWKCPWSHERERVHKKGRKCLVDLVRSFFRCTSIVLSHSHLFLFYFSVVHPYSPRLVFCRLTDCLAICRTVGDFSKTKRKQGFVSRNDEKERERKKERYLSFTRYWCLGVNELSPRRRRSTAPEFIGKEAKFASCQIFLLFIIY